ncbi:MAG: efflux RND transporter periplasmic adaptor subunit [Planctomycetales bacterium]|nr:efflux RND transporter periplasmic adaptor subunit [Planctomycetales bacterium]
MKSLLVWLGSLGLVLLTLAVLAGLGFYKYSQMQKAMNMPPPPEQPITVVVAPAQEITYRQSTTMIGTILAPRSIELSNEIAGTVSAVHFEPGQIVEQDQLLLEFDTSVERAQLDAAKARRRIAESVYERTREAAATRAVTPSELDEATAQLAQATAEVEELDAIIRRKTLRAPFRAKIGLADTHPGQFLPSGFRIASLQSIDDYVFVDFRIPQSAADSVHVGDTVALLVQHHQLAGTVHAIDAQADRQSRNLLARIKVASNPDFLVPGDSVKVLLEYGEPQTTAAVPVEALRVAPMQTFVYVVEPDSEGALRARERSVVPGPSRGEWLSIRSGLSAGERVAADGSFKLRDGALVAVSEM